MAATALPRREPGLLFDRAQNEPSRRLADPAVKAKLERAGYPVAGASPDKLEALLKSEIDKWSAIIKSVGIKIN